MWVGRQVDGGGMGGGATERVGMMRGVLPLNPVEGWSGNLFVFQTGRYFDPIFAV